MRVGRNRKEGGETRKDDNEMNKLLIIALILATAWCCEGCFKEYETSYEYHTMKAGETVWDVACDAYQRQDRHDDVRYVVDDIAEANGLFKHGDVKPIVAGMVIKVPLQKERK